MSSAAERYYSGSYNYGSGGDIYVHLHVNNIGRAMQGQPVNPDDVANIFRQRKQQALQASKFQFKTLFKNSLDNNSQQLLNQVFNNDDLMTQLQQQMGKKFQQALAVDKMRKLMELQRSGITTQNFAKELISNSEQSLKNFNDLLMALEEAVKLLNMDTGALGAIFADRKNFHSTSASDMGMYLSNALDSYIKNNNKKLMTNLEIQQAEEIINRIRPLANVLKKIKTDIGSGKEKSKKAGAIKKITQDIFNTGFAESISAMLKQTAYVEIDKTFKSSLTGAEKVQIQYSDEFGRVVNNTDSIASAGKADAMFSNVKLHINNIGNLGDKTINLNIGISDKFYKSNYFPGLKGNKKDQSFSSGSGGSLTEALWSSFGSNLRYLYFAYNALSHGNRKGWNVAQGALNEVILTRQIVRLFASRGGNADFAQFMFVNGQIVPIWDIIMSTTKNISLSSSEKGSDKQPVNISIQGRGDIQKSAQNYRRTLEQRIYAVNSAVRKAKIKAHVNLDYL